LNLENKNNIPSKFGNPNIFGLSAFGFSLFLLGMELVVTKKIAGAVLYAVLFAGVLEFIAGMWMIGKGESYLASILSVFGGWLIGLFLLMTQGKTLGVFNPISFGWYILAIEPPLVMLAIPAFKFRKNILICAFVSLFLLVAFMGAGLILGNQGMEFLAGIFAFISAVFIWWLLWHNIHELMHN
jgi:succinate-acetate transporter protein